MGSDAGAHGPAILRRTRAAAGLSEERDAVALGHAGDLSDQARRDGMEPQRQTHRRLGHSSDRARLPASAAAAAGTGGSEFRAGVDEPAATGAADLRTGGPGSARTDRCGPDGMELRRL